MKGKDKAPGVPIEPNGQVVGEPGLLRSLDDTRVSRKPAVPRILVVEDQEDVRRLLVTVLEIEGYRVHEASNARDGLKCLQDARYDLVLSDYAMPGGTGTWMLHEATRSGLLDGTVALIVTAHPEVRELSNVEVLRKPFDLDRLLEQVRHVLGEAVRDDSAYHIDDF